MSVEREHSTIIAAPPDRVAQALQKVLAQPGHGYHYVNTTVSPDGLSCNTTIHPRLYPLIMETAIAIRLLPSPDGASTTVNCGTQSQEIVQGDVFGMYDKYLNHLVDALEAEVAAPQQPPV